MKNGSAPLSLEELANGYCLLMANGYRLIEDGEKLSAQKRFLGALGCFEAASEELARGHLLTRAVLLEDDDVDGWRRFWAIYEDRLALRKLLEDEVHHEIYKNEDARRRYNRAFPLLGLDFTHIRFEKNGDRFLPPGEPAAGYSIDETARIYYEYVLGLYHGLNFYGLPNPATQVQTFWGLRAGHRNRSLAR